MADSENIIDPQNPLLWDGVSTEQKRTMALVLEEARSTFTAARFPTLLATYTPLTFHLCRPTTMQCVCALDLLLVMYQR